MKITQPGAHVDQMLRQTRAHHVQLSSMADIKANMLLTMSSVVMTIAGPYLLKDNSKVASIVLITFCLLTIALATYSAMPKLPLTLHHGGTSNLKRPGFNLLFFGDFLQLSYPEFESAMEELMNDPSLTYKSQVQEIYTLGVFLAIKKYRFLRLAYISFITGLFASGLVLLLQM